MKVYIAFFLVHICIVILMFDVYFQTKVITGLNPVKNFTKPYAKRLVLFVGDGLRSDTFFGNSKMGSVEHAPFLRSIMVEAASWGVSHTRVPTESRPGHVAIIAGFYEDPSAVFKGWKKNPVLFDSVFNQSVATFSWGSPDIVPMFSNELSNPNIFYYNYEEEDQDLSGRNGTVEFLNSWVFNKFEEMYNNISNNKFMRDLWNKPGIIFFFHFLGIDVAGHAFNPNSPGYLQSVRQTDALIRDITKMIEDYYNDNRTSFIFTSDHGMTDWGSHGAGSASETETPLVVWGAGIKHSHCNHFFTPDCFKNVSQADIAVLMSILLGRSIPVHSTGVLPIDYLDIPIHDKVMALFQNSHQLLNQFRQKEKDIKSNVAKILYTPFIGLEKDIIAFYFKRISEKMQSGLYDVALKITKEFIDLVIEGSDYYDRYYQTVKLIFLDLTVIGLIFCVLSEIVPLITISESDEELKQSKYSTINKFNFKLFALFIIILVSIYLLLLGTSTLPVKFILYLLLPTPFWFYALTNNKWLWKLCHIVDLRNINLCCDIILYFIGLSLLFFSFYYRWMLTLLMVVVMVWPLIKMKIVEPLKTLWILSSILVATFPLLPAVGARPNILFVILSAAIWIVIGILWDAISSSRSHLFTFDKKIRLQTVLIIPILINICHIDYRFSYNKGLANINQILSFTFLVINFLTLFYNRTAFLIPRFISISISLGVMFLQFSSTFEGLFPILLAFNLLIWMLFEISANHTDDTSNNIIYYTIPERQLSRVGIDSHNMRQSFFYLSYIVISYFGIGNIESISSFDIAWVRGFVTLFSPFFMTALVLFKSVIPFLMVTCAFRILVIKTQANVHQLFYLVLIYCDMLGLIFLCNVKNVGSWLEIGKSISRFVIIESIVLFLILLYGFTSFIIRSHKIEDNLPYRKQHVC